MTTAHPETLEQDTQPKPPTRRDLLLEDILWLHECGEPAFEWPKRVKRTPQGLVKALQRAGRHDLAGCVETVLRPIKTHP